MQLSTGQIVLLKHTRERARVIQALEHGQWMIEAEMDKERFPVHEDDIDPVVGSSKPQPQVTADVTPGEIRLYPDPDGPAVQLAFLPVGELDFNAALLNFSKETLVFSARLLTNKGQQWEKHGLLGPVVGLPLGHLYRDLLNESATVEVSLSRKAALGTDSKQEKDVKLKPKLFHKNTKTVSWFPEEVAVFDVFAKAKIERNTTPTIQAYTKANAPVISSLPKVSINHYGVRAAAEFELALDLHIEKLVDDPMAYQPGEMLEIQLMHMNRYLEVAIRLGIERVHLIHGKGTGALRNKIHDTLSKMGDIEGYKHEFHPKYGHGATEVILRA